MTSCAFRSLHKREVTIAKQRYSGRMTAPPISVQSGELAAMRLFDIAFAIDLVHAQRLWTIHIGNAGSRSRLNTAPAKAVAFGVPPLLLALEPVTIEIDGVEATAHVSVRLYDFGVVALALRVPVCGLPWDAFARRFNALDRSVGEASSSSIWAEALEKVRAVIAPALDRPTEAVVQEDYLLGTVKTLEPALDGATLSECVDMVGLLSGESRPLSAGAQRDLLQRTFSYFADDLVVLTWDLRAARRFGCRRCH